MMLRFFLFLIGFGLMVVGCVFFILYLNLLEIGYSFSEYINYVTNRIEVYYLPIGFILITLTIYWKGEKNGFHLRYINQSK